MTSNKFCCECGAKLLTEKVGAEKYVEHYFEDMYPYSKFDSQTGERQYVMRYYCPNARWYNNHTNFIDKDIIK